MRRTSFWFQTISKGSFNIIVKRLIPFIKYFFASSQRHIFRLTFYCRHATENQTKHRQKPHKRTPWEISFFHKHYSFFNCKIKLLKPVTVTALLSFYDFSFCEIREDHFPVGGFPVRILIIKNHQNFLRRVY